MVNTQEPLHYGHLPVYPNEWANDLCDVCSDSKVCLCVLCCFGFYNCYLHHKAGQCKIIMKTYYLSYKFDY